MLKRNTRKKRELGAKHHARQRTFTLGCPLSPRFAPGYQCGMRISGTVNKFMNLRLNLEYESERAGLKNAAVEAIRCCQAQTIGMSSHRGVGWPVTQRPIGCELKPRSLSVFG